MARPTGRRYVGPPGRDERLNLEPGLYQRDSLDSRSIPSREVSVYFVISSVARLKTSSSSMNRKRSHNEVDPASDIEDQSETGLSHPELLDDDPFLEAVDSVNARVSDMSEEDTNLVLSVFNAVWDEFDSWREGWNEDQLVDLGVNNLTFGQKTSLDSSELDSPPQSLSPLSDNSDMDCFAPSAQANGTRTFQVYTVNETQGGLDSRDLFTFSTTLATNETAGQPSSGDFDDPAFESYASVNRSIFIGDDSDDLPFIPFADEIDEYSVEPSEQPSDSKCLLSSSLSHSVQYGSVECSAQTREFPYRKHMERHMHLRWQTQMPDPDGLLSLPVMLFGFTSLTPDPPDPTSRYCFPGNGIPIDVRVRHHTISSR